MIERAVDLDLQRVEAVAGLPVMLGDEAAGIGLVAADRIAVARQISSEASSVSAGAQLVP